MQEEGGGDVGGRHRKRAAVSGGRPIDPGAGQCRTRLAQPETPKGTLRACEPNRDTLLRELGSGKVGYNKYELVNVMARKMDEAYLAGYISKAENVRAW